MPTAKVQNWMFEYTQAEEFRLLKREIFTEHQYYVDLRTSKPRIIDAGAHIGLATGYFKWLYPDAEIVAIEPNPRLALLLNRNIETNQWWGVDIVEAALVGVEGQPLTLDSWKHMEDVKIEVIEKLGGKVPFYFDKSADQWYSTGGLKKGAWNGKQQSWEISVHSRILTDFLTMPVDLLKLDIEGAELAVLEGAESKLTAIKHIIMEFHPVPGNLLPKIERLLSKHGFVVTVRKRGGRDEGLKLVEATRLD